MKTVKEYKYEKYVRCDGSCKRVCDTRGNYTLKTTPYDTHSVQSVRCDKKWKSDGNYIILLTKFKHDIFPVVKCTLCDRVLSVSVIMNGLKSHLPVKSTRSCVELSPLCKMLKDVKQVE